MTEQQQYESQLHRAVRKMIERKKTVQSFVTHDGKMIHNVDGYNLTAQQILELDSRNELTTWGIREYAKKYEERLRRPCHFQSFCPECTESKPVSMNRVWLCEALDNNTEVAVVSVCGHSWNLPAHEKHNLRTALRAGSI